VIGGWPLIHGYYCPAVVQMASPVVSLTSALGNRFGKKSGKPLLMARFMFKNHHKSKQIP
jgi:hypothetical protein